ncbi:MAG: class I SAM-dependent methyltransferase [Clostridia bacterium]|nr:class I SAM-dependent methyltransferase [Clostridia bacterium]
MEKAYSVMADYYEYLTYDCDAERWSQYVCNRIKSLVKSGGGIDLGCGTGIITRALHGKGYQVVGIDLNGEMLSNANSFNDGILYLQKDLRKVTEFSDLSFITAVNDVFNYIKPTELQKVLLNFNKMLKIGGALLIDFSSEYKLTKVLGNEPCFFDDEEVSYIWLNKLKGDKLTMEITYFLLDKESGLYSRREEKHIQYVHKTCDIEKAFLSAGFEIIKKEGHLGKKLTDDSHRINFLVKKVKEK